MIVAGEYSFNNGRSVITKKHRRLLKEITEVIKAVDADQHKTKKSKEKTMPGRNLYSPISLNKAFKVEFSKRNWNKVKVQMRVSDELLYKKV